jgi:small GTP-binding protein
MNERILTKVVFIGNDQSDKTNLVHQVLDTRPPEAAGKANPMDFLTRVFSMPDYDVKMVAWDLAGEERFSMVRKTCYQGTQSAAVVVDLADPDAVEEVKNWLDEIAEEIPMADVLIVGNKHHLQWDAAIADADTLLPLLDYPQVIVDTSTGEGIGLVKDWLLEKTIAKAQPVLQ